MYNDERSNVGMHTVTLQRHTLKLTVTRKRLSIRRWSVVVCIPTLQRWEREINIIINTMISNTYKPIKQHTRFLYPFLMDRNKVTEAVAALETITHRGRNNKTHPIWEPINHLVFIAKKCWRE